MAAAATSKAADFAKLATTEEGAKLKGWGMLKRTVVSSAPADQPPVTDTDVMISALYVRDGLKGRSINYALDPSSLRLHQLFHGRAWRVLFLCAAAVHMALAFVEPVAPRSAHPVRAGTALAERVWTCVGVEGVCVAVYVADLVLLWATMRRSRVASEERSRAAKETGTRAARDTQASITPTSRAGETGEIAGATFWQSKWAVIRMAAVLLVVADVSASVASSFTVIRFSRPVRPLILVSRSTNVRKVFAGVLRTSTRAVPVFLLIAILISFFAFLGAAIYGPDEAGASAHMQTIRKALYTFLLVQTSPPAMLLVGEDLWARSPANEVFIVVFVLMGNLFLFKLVIAVAYKSYKEYTKAKMMGRVKKRQVAFRAAFKLIARDRGGPVPLVVAREDWMRLLRHLRPNLPESHADIMFEAVDKEHDDLADGFVPQKGFLQLCALVDVQFRKRRKVTTDLDELREAGVRQFQKAIVLGSARHRFVIADLVILCFVFLSFVQSYVVAQNQAAEQDHWRLVGLLVLGVFVVESLLRLFCYGPVRYWQNGFHRLDTFCNVVGIAYYFYAGLQPPIEHQTVFNVSLVVRAMRLTRIVQLWSMLLKIMRTVDRVLPAVLRLFVVFVSLLYCFATVAENMYADKLDPEAAMPGQPLHGTPWAAHAQQLTFQDFPSAMFTLFVTAMIGGWSMTMDAAYSMTQSVGTYFFFFVFRISISMLFLPVFVGFVIEAFVTNYVVVEAEHDKDDQIRAEAEAKAMARREASRRRTLTATGGRGGKRVEGGLDGISLPRGVGAAALAGSDGGGDGGGGGAGAAAPQRDEESGDAGADSEEKKAESDHGEASDDEEDDEEEYDLGVQRKNSDVAYAQFDVSTVLAQADMDRIVAEHRQQAEQIAERDRRISGMASSIVKQQVRVRQLESEVQHLRAAAQAAGVDVTPRAAPRGGAFFGSLVSDARTAQYAAEASGADSTAADGLGASE